MTQYKLDERHFEIMRDMYDEEEADGICFCRHTFLSENSYDYLTICYYKFETNAGLTMLEAVPIPDTINGAVSGSLASSITQASEYLDLDSLTSAQNIPTGTRFKYKIGGTEVLAIKGTELTMLNTSNISDSQEPITDNADGFGLVYFKIEDLLTVAEERNYIYLSVNLRSYSNLTNMEIVSNGYTNTTNFRTLIATPERIFEAPIDNSTALNYTSGKPCPPFWKPNFRFVFLKNRLKEDSLIEDKERIEELKERLEELKERLEEKKDSFYSGSFWFDLFRLFKKYLTFGK